MAKQKSVFRKPTLTRADSGERKVSWLELYFDLFFVVIMYYLVHELAYDLSATNLFHYTLMFICAWWLWIGYTYYKEMFENHGLEIRIFTFLYMIPVAGLAVFSHNAMGENFIYFVWSYVIARIIQTGAWLHAALQNRETEKIAQRFIIGSIIAVLLSVLATTLPPEQRVYMFAFALFVDFIAPFFTMRHQRKLAFNLSRLPERIGLFVIIIIGEIVRGVINYLSTTPNGITSEYLVIAFLGFALSYGIWSSYFDFIADKSLDNNIDKTFLWGYLHIILLYALTLIGAILLKIDFENITQANLTLSAYFIAGLTLFLLTLGILGKVLNTKNDVSLKKRANAKLILGIVFIIFGLFAYDQSIMVLFGGAVIILFAQMIYSIKVWKRILDDNQ